MWNLKQSKERTLMNKDTFAAHVSCIVFQVKIPLRVFLLMFYFPTPTIWVYLTFTALSLYHLRIK